MARGKKRSIEEKIADKEELIAALQRRIKAEQEELEAFYNEKKLKDLEGLDSLVKTAGLSSEEVEEALNLYLEQRQDVAS